MQQRLVEPARRVSWRPLVDLFAAIALWPAVVVAAPAPASLAGAWTLSRDDLGKTCQINLRTSVSTHGWIASMPSGCRRAIPALKAVQAWSVPHEGAISLDDAGGTGTILFEQSADGTFHATAPDGSPLTLAAAETSAAPAVMDLSASDGGGSASILTLEPNVPPAPPSHAGSQPAMIQLAKAAPTTTKAVPAQEVAGQYAVMRGDRDTGCMVTLDASARGPKSSLKAHLAPACRDQGIIIFDPIGWQMSGVRLVLTARKGHTLQLEKSEAGIWAKDPTDSKSIGLKHL